MGLSLPLSFFVSHRHRGYNGVTSKFTSKHTITGDKTLAICSTCTLLKDCPYKAKDPRIIGCTWDIGPLGGLHIDADKLRELWNSEKRAAEKKAEESQELQKK